MIPTIGTPAVIVPPKMATLGQSINNVWCHRNHPSGNQLVCFESDDSCPTLTRQPLPFPFRQDWPTAPDRACNRSQLITFFGGFFYQFVDNPSSPRLRPRRSDVLRHAESPPFSAAILALLQGISDPLFHLS
jgi:hypothetical protein